LQLAERCVQFLSANVKESIKEYTSEVGNMNDVTAVLMEPLFKLDSQLNAIIDLQQYGIMTHS
jgi:hypothetical protein